MFALVMVEAKPKLPAAQLGTPVGGPAGGDRIVRRHELQTGAGDPLLGALVGRSALYSWST